MVEDDIKYDIQLGSNLLILICSCYSFTQIVLIRHKQDLINNYVQTFRII